MMKYTERSTAFRIWDTTLATVVILGCFVLIIAGGMWAVFRLADLVMWIKGW